MPFINTNLIAIRCLILLYVTLGNMVTTVRYVYLELTLRTYSTISLDMFEYEIVCIYRHMHMYMNMNICICTYT
jgi:hypothetical protein